ncbi:hypothetical protein HDU96_000055 [Phlyctochytrium bullatum]|nr:hypothetical protein HDU96_000055 [Phlyctochytrium bullatum]
MQGTGLLYPEAAATQRSRSFTEPLRIALLKLVKEAVMDQPHLMPHSSNLPWQGIVNTLNVQHGTWFTADQARLRVSNSWHGWSKKLMDGDVMSQTEEYRLLGELYGINTRAELEAGTANVGAEMQTNDYTVPATSAWPKASAGQSPPTLSTLNSEHPLREAPQDRNAPTAPETSAAITTSYSPAGCKRRRSQSSEPDNTLSESGNYVRWSEPMTLELLRLAHATGLPIVQIDVNSIAVNIRNKFGCHIKPNNVRYKLHHLRQKYLQAFPNRDANYSDAVWEWMGKTYAVDVDTNRSKRPVRAAKSVLIPRSYYYIENNMLPDSMLIDDASQISPIAKNVIPRTTLIQSQAVPKAASSARSYSDMSAFTASPYIPTNSFLKSLAADFATSSDTVATVADPALADLPLTLPPPQESAPIAIDWTPAMDSDLLRLMIEFTSNATEAGLDDVVSKLASAHGVFVQFDQLNQRYQELEWMYRAAVASRTTVAGLGELHELLKLAFGGQTANHVEAAEQSIKKESERGRSSSDRSKHRRSVSRGRTRTPRHPPPNAPRSSSRTIGSSRSSCVESTAFATVAKGQPSVSPPVPDVVPLLHQILENQKTYMAAHEQSTKVIKQLRSQIQTLEDTVKDLSTKLHKNEIHHNFASLEPPPSMTESPKPCLKRKQKIFHGLAGEMTSMTVTEVMRKLVKVVGKRVKEKTQGRMKSLAVMIWAKVLAMMGQKMKKMGGVRTGGNQELLQVDDHG